MLSANGADGGGMRERTKDSEGSPHLVIKPERQSRDDLDWLPYTQFRIFTIVRKVYRSKSTYTQISNKINLQLERDYCKFPSKLWERKSLFIYLRQCCCYDFPWSNTMKGQTRPKWIFCKPAVKSITHYPLTKRNLWRCTQKGQAGPAQPMLQKWLPKKESDNERKKTSPFSMPGHWYFTFIPSSWEDRAKPGFLILLFRGHGKWFGTVVECWRISVVTVHSQRWGWGFLFIIQTVRHFQGQLIAQLLQNRRRKQELRKKRP